MITFFDEEAAKISYQEMKGYLEGKSQEEVWKIAVMYAENFVHEKQRQELLKHVGNIDINEIFDLATSMVQEKVNAGKNSTT